MIPEIISPAGGEEFYSNEITIRWTLPSVGGEIWHEIYYAHNFDGISEPDWRQIASVSKTVTSYVWRFGSNVRGNRIRIGIRTRNSRGERSQMAVSGGDFSIKRKRLQPPIVLSPIDGGRYDKSVNITLSEHNLERGIYHFYFSSVSAGIVHMPIKQSVSAANAKSVIWETIDLPPAKDYAIQAFVSDESGNTSESTFIRNIEIAHDGFFLIDTKPPESSITINVKSENRIEKNAVFTKTRSINLKVLSYDETTAMHSVQFVEGSRFSRPELPTDAANVLLSTGDGIKTVELHAQDYGANRNNQHIRKIFETFISFDSGAKVIDIASEIGSSVAWAIVSGQNNYIYKIDLFPSAVAALKNTPTSIAIFNSVVFVGTKTPANNGVLIRFNNPDIVEVHDFKEIDSIINAMTVHRGKLYMGMENGKIFSFDGVMIRYIDRTDHPIGVLASSNGLLYLSEKHNTHIHRLPI